MKFVDTAKIVIKSGNGGKGHVSFRREKFVPKGGPDGGNGGKGGDVIFKVDPHLNTLLDFHYKMKFNAENGHPGGKNHRTGKDGKEIIIKLPCGTLVKDRDTEEILVDLVNPDEEVIFARGGKGGRGNAEFTTPTNQTPRYADPGYPGLEMEVKLELKLLADVGIVGFPNAGKSTLISVISSAKPKIADYPFTTLIPNLGIVKVGEGMSYAVADIPGLIEGASDGKGLGIQFLRHIDRTSVLLFMLDATDEDIKTEYKVLCNELKKYNPEMEDRTRIICISKIDTVDEVRKKELNKIQFGKKAAKKMMISAVTGESIEMLKWELWNLIKS